MSKENCASFEFVNSLNDFLNQDQKGKSITAFFTDNPGIKDIIESLGVPHTEIGLIEVNSIVVDLSYRLKENDNVVVYPTLTGAVPQTNANPAFILDVHLGKLARLLRLLGFDALYRNDFSDQDLVDRACCENRILLTRDVGVLKYRRLIYGYWVRSTQPVIQAKEVVSKYKLCSIAAPLSRCLECGGVLVNTEKSLIASRLEPRTLNFYDQFKKCIHCHKIYWQGSHVQKLNSLIKQICPQNN